MSGRKGGRDESPLPEKNRGGGIVIVALGEVQLVSGPSSVRDTAKMG